MCLRNLSLYFTCVSHNDRGCEHSCKFYHPNACRDSLKDRKCSRNDCRFFHLYGTKKVEFNGSSQYKNQYSNQNNQSWNNKRSNNGVETRNRFEPLRSNEDHSDDNGKSKTNDAQEKIMQELF